jgi:hypothetical protein
MPVVFTPGSSAVVPPVFTPGGSHSSTPGTGHRAPAGPPKHGATRYLCCAMQLDAKLAERAVAQIFDEPRRAVASSPEVNLACVLAYALASCRRRLVLNSLLAVLVVLTVIGGGLFDPGVLVLGTLLAWLMVAIERYYTYYGIIVPKLTHGAFDPNKAPAPTSASQAARLAEIARCDGGNVTVFQGFTPFVGFGKLTETWAFPIRVDIPKSGATAVKPFRVNDLYRHVADAVENLRLPGVQVQDQLFVNGGDLSLNLNEPTRRSLLPDETRAPVPNVPPKIIRDLRESNGGRSRPYLALQVRAWEGQVVVTQFLRFTLMREDGLLFVEHSTSLLAPVRAAYHEVDALPDRPTFHHVAPLLIGALPRAIGLAIGSVPAVLVALRGLFDRTEVRQLRQIRHHQFNYGALMSVREDASDHQYYRYYQMVDGDMHTKVIDRRILESLVGFLGQHDIDTSELRENQSVINNNGIFVGSNASLSLSGSAVGVGRNAVGNILQGAAGRITGGQVKGR